jgi:hypothetical protein
MPEGGTQGSKGGQKVKAGQDRSIRTFTPVDAVDFVGGAQPNLVSGNYEVIGGGSGIHGDFVQLYHREKISVAGIQAEDFSMTSVATAIVPLATWFKTDTGYPIDVRDIHVITTTPLPDALNTLTALNQGNYDASPIDMTRVLLCSITDYQSDPGGGFNLINRGSSAWGGATSFSTDLLYVYRVLIISMRPFYNQTTGTPHVIGGPQGRLVIPQTMVVAGIKLEDFDAVQTAMSIYRANDLQQTFDN